VSLARLKLATDQFVEAKNAGEHGEEDASLARRTFSGGWPQRRRPGDSWIKKEFASKTQRGGASGIESIACAFD